MYIFVFFQSVKIQLQRVFKGFGFTWVWGWKAQMLDWCFPFLGEWLRHWRYLINNKIIPLGFAKSFLSLSFKITNYLYNL